MKIKQLTLLVALTLGFVTQNFAQHKNYDIKNGFALGGGITQFNINTDNFDTKAGNGWLIHASATGDLPHRWYNVSYGMQLSENKFSMLASSAADVTSYEEVDMKLFTAQLAFLFHVKAIPNLLTIDAGPMLQYNGKLEAANSDQEDYFIKNFTALQIKDVADISNINVNGAIGATLGFKFIKLRAQYIYGFLNSLDKLNKQDLNVGNTNFKGNQSMLAFMAMITF